MTKLCSEFKDHEAHDDCPGGVMCQYCPNLLRRDLMVMHLQQAHTDKLESYREVVSETVRKLSEESGVPLALVHSERVSGGAPATHTGRPAQHSGRERLIMCPMGAVSPNEKQCPFPGSNYRPDVYKHLRHDHAYSEEAVGEYLADVWYADEPRSKWKERTYYRHYGIMGANLVGDLKLIKTAEVQDSIVFAAGLREAARLEQERAKTEALHVPLGAPKCPKGGCELTHPHLHTAAEMAEGDPLDNYCDHPNGFGVMGCPCGASRPDEDAPRMFRNIDTGKDEYALRCPATLDHAYDVYPESQMLRHLRHEHNWPQDKIDDWAESVGVATQSLIPDPLVEDMAQRQQRQAEVDAFLNPQITVEDLMHTQDKPDIEQAVTEWWMDRAEEEARSVVPKAVEYGSNSLMQLGRKMAQLQGREVADDEALELGCWANLVQKVERMTDSVMRGERCSDDTIYDVGIYIKMVQRIRDAGSWPGV